MTLKQWKPKQMKKTVTVIGAAIVDVLVGPVNASVFDKGSQAMEMSEMTFGGDALNEAVALSKLGVSVELVSKVGQDEAGTRVVHFLEKNGVDTSKVIQEEDLITGINVVLIDDKGERHFLTNPQSSLRKLALTDVEAYIEQAADIVSFASMFVSPLLDIPAMEQLFCQIKSKPGRMLVADMTKAKNGERLEDLTGLLPYVNYLLANEAEVAMLTGCDDTRKNVELLLSLGAQCVIIKRGSKGCLIGTSEAVTDIPAYPVEQMVDTTGAGDCFAAGFLWGLTQGMSLEECGYMACAVASCVVECVGATDGLFSVEEPLRRYRHLRDTEE